MISRESLQHARVLIAGDAMLDRYWFGEVSRISPEAPVPVVRVRREEERAGGAANVARNAAALGAKVRLLTVVGDDEPGRSLERLLREADVDAVLSQDAAFKTTVKLRVVGRQQQLLRIDFEESPGAGALQAKLAHFENSLHDAHVVILSDYAKGALLHIERMIAAARAAGRFVLVDPKGDDYERYRGASVLTPNKSEFREVAGSWKSESDFIERAHRLRERFDIGALLITRSEEGMTLVEAGGEQHVPAVAREVFDVSGAGDTAIATLGAMVAAGASLAEAVRWANKAAGIVVGKLGTAVVHPDELFS